MVLIRGPQLLVHAENSVQGFTSLIENCCLYKTPRGGKQRCVALSFFAAFFSIIICCCFLMWGGKKWGQERTPVFITENTCEPRNTFPLEHKLQDMWANLLCVLHLRWWNVRNAIAKALNRSCLKIGVSPTGGLSVGAASFSAWLSSTDYDIGAGKI